jgi:hypothetical protein
LKIRAALKAKNMAREENPLRVSKTKLYFDDEKNGIGTLSMSKRRQLEKNLFKKIKQAVLSLKKKPRLAYAV